MPATIEDLENRLAGVEATLVLVRAKLGMNTPAEEAPVEVDPPKPSTAISAVDAVLFKAVHLNSGVIKEQKLRWSLNGAARGGFNAAVLFTKAGQIVTLEAADGTAKAWRAGTVTSQAFIDVPVGTDLASVIKNGARLRLAAGSYKLSKPIGALDVIIVGAGLDKTLVEWTGADRVRNEHGQLYTVTLFNLTDSAVHGLHVDSTRRRNVRDGKFIDDKDLIPDLFVTGGKLTVVGVRGTDFNKFLNLNNRPKDVLIHGCEGIRCRDYFIWGEGENLVIYSNVVTDVIYNHVVRVCSSYVGTQYAATYIAIDGNKFKNEDHTHDKPVADTVNVAKGTIVLQSARFAYVSSNVLEGPEGAGPLPVPDNGDAAARCSVVVFEGNTTTMNLNLWGGLSNALVYGQSVDFPNHGDKRLIENIQVIGGKVVGGIPAVAKNISQVPA